MVSRSNIVPRVVLSWIGFKLLRAVATTEVISFPGVLELVSRRGRIYGHAANRILYSSCRIGSIFHVGEPRSIERDKY